MKATRKTVINTKEQFQEPQHEQYGEPKRQTKQVESSKTRLNKDCRSSSIRSKNKSKNKTKSRSRSKSKIKQE
jgi:hypothetical protein